jgi:hypothetical protein
MVQFGLKNNYSYMVETVVQDDTEGEGKWEGGATQTGRLAEISSPRHQVC